MRRRTVLASLTALLAGCNTQTEPRDTSTPTEEPTPPPDVTTITETRPLPTPSEISSPAAAQSYVETHERRYVYNELVGGFGTSQPAIDISVDAVDVAVVHETEAGYYLLSTAEGEAEYYDPDGSPSHAGRNASSVAHFVNGETHRRIPFNAYRCQEPGVPTPTESGDSEPTARFQLYDFSTAPDYDQPDEGGHAVDVTVRGDDGTVLDRTYQTSLPLTIQPRVTETPGEYTLTASLDDGPTTEYDWSLSTPVDSDWWALAVIVTDGGEVTVQQLYPDDVVGLPERTLCQR